MIQFIEDAAHATGIDQGVHLVTGGKRLLDEDGSYNPELVHKAEENTLSGIEVTASTLYIDRGVHALTGGKRLLEEDCTYNPDFFARDRDAMSPVGGVSSRPTLTSYLHAGTDGSVPIEPVPLLLNSQTAMPFEAENFKGECLWLHRVPDDGTAPYPYDAGSSPYEAYFSTCKRQFEFRLQGVFPKKPRALYFSAELEDHLKISYSLSMILNALAKFAGTIAPTARLNFDHEFDSLGNPARPYWAIPAQDLEVLVRTPAGQTPPSIYENFKEMPESQKLEEFSKLQDGDTLTIVFWDMHISFMKWGFVNMPLGLDTKWTNVIGDRSVHVTMYDSLHECPKGLHSQKSKQYVFTLICALGGGAQSEASEGRTASNNTTTCGAALRKLEELFKPCFGKACMDIVDRATSWWSARQLRGEILDAPSTVLALQNGQQEQQPHKFPNVEIARESAR